MAAQTAFTKVVDNSVVALRGNETVQKLLPMLGGKGEKLDALGEQAENAARYLGMLPPELSFGGMFSNFESVGMAAGTALKVGGKLAAVLNGDDSAKQGLMHDLVFGTASTAMGAIKSHSQMLAALDIMPTANGGKAFSENIISQITTTLLGEDVPAAGAPLATPAKAAPVLTAGIPPKQGSTPSV